MIFCQQSDIPTGKTRVDTLGREGFYTCEAFLECDGCLADELGSGTVGGKGWGLYRMCEVLVRPSMSIIQITLGKDILRPQLTYQQSKQKLLVFVLHSRI